MAADGLLERAHELAALDALIEQGRSARAGALHRLGQADEALELMSEDLSLARRWGAAGTVSRALRELGELQGEAGLPLLEEAVEVVDGSPARLEHAKALAALGAALRRAWRPTDAREPLREALELASRCGAGAWSSTGARRFSIERRVCRP